MSEPIRVIVCGSRSWTDPWPIHDFIESLPPGSTVVNGGAQGADAIARDLAAGRGDLHTVTMFADWKLHGKAAGPIRNRKMLAFRPVALVRAFRLPGHSPGTDDMIRIAQAAGVRVEVTHGGGERAPEIGGR